MTEAQLQDAILETAALLGWRCYHPRPARTQTGWRTAAQGNGAAGYPDLTMTRNGYLILAELKAAKGRVAPAQQAWLDDLLAVSVGVDRVHVYVWKPEHWTSGLIEQVLRFTGTARDVAA
jgi:hypothetical protein